MEQSVFDFDSLLSVSFHDQKLKSQLVKLLNMITSQQNTIDTLNTHLQHTTRQLHEQVYRLDNRIQSGNLQLLSLKTGIVNAECGYLEIDKSIKKCEFLKEEHESFNNRVTLLEREMRDRFVACEELNQNLLNKYEMLATQAHNSCRENRIFRDEYAIAKNYIQQNTAKIQAQILQLKTRSDTPTSSPVNEPQIPYHLIATITDKIELIQKKIHNLVPPAVTAPRIMRPTVGNISSSLNGSFMSSRPTEVIINHTSLTPESELAKTAENCKAIEACREKNLLLEEQMKYVSKQLNIMREKVDANEKSLSIMKKIDINVEAKSMIQSEIHKLVKQYQEKIDNKVDTSEFEKNIKKLQQRLNTMHESIFGKCDKEEIKRALEFLETKIKQIIVVIANSEKEDKQALFTTKNLIKCLSCDKEVEKLATTVSDLKLYKHYAAKCSEPEKMGRFGMTQNSIIRKKVRQQKEAESKIRQIEMLD